MIRIEQVTTEGPALSVVRTLFSEYAEELNVDLCFQDFEEELKHPLHKYGPPKGCLLLAFHNDKAAGCVALQPLKKAGVCEMKRLYTRPDSRKVGLGDELVKTLMLQAKALGYKRMVLDTLEKLGPAIRLYERNGFKNTSAYYLNPLPHVVYMEKEL